MNGSNSIVRFTTLLGVDYDLERAGEVNSGIWSAFATNLSGIGGVLAATDTNAASQAQGFYRVRLLP